MIYQVGESIPIIQAIFKNNGTPETGLSLFITIIQASTGNVIINGASVTELGNSLYQYIWNNGITTDSTFLYVIKAGGGLASAGTIYGSGTFRIVTTKQQLTDTIDLSDGRAI